MTEGSPAAPYARGHGEWWVRASVGVAFRVAPGLRVEVVLGVDLGVDAAGT
ncbi:hypothetical protein C8D89_101619 [Actinomycetospora cinnamomea]|uniref:Uncharacterized protein n=1 Tax=Actinomycetospora cinnamomea TaxID=663609 RepID=A0A2U1FRL1_9PSEU|nr:hypothetical protein C8D89_101619 [Actinomycetospora cinnamomea]